MEQIILNAQHQASLIAQHQTTSMIGECIKEMIFKTSDECLPLLKGKMNEFFNAIMKIGVNPSPLKSQIEKYMASVDCLDITRRAHSMETLNI